MNHPVKISVVTAVYNGAQYLPELIDSVLAQDYPHFEHIIIDNGSTDDGATHSVLQSYPHLRWWIMAGPGVYEVQKKGMTSAKGDYIVLINADDKFVVPGAFKRVVEYLRKHPDSDLVYGNTSRMDHEGRMLPDLSLHRPPSLWLMRHLMYVQHCSAFISRKLVIDQRIELDPTLTLAADWDWMIRLFDASESIGWISAPLSVFRFHDEQRSRKVHKQVWIQERRTIVERHGGSYLLHRIFHGMMIFRGMVLIGLWTLHTQGIGALLLRVKRWAGTRLGS